MSVHRVPLILRGGSGGLRLALNYASFAISASVLGPLRMPRDIDVVFVFQPSPVSVAVPALILGRLQAVPVVMWVQDVWPDILSGTGAVQSERLLRVIGAFSRFLHRNCNLLLATSESFRVRLAQDTSVDRVRYLPQWVEQFYQPISMDAGAEERSELPLGFTVVFAGNLGSAQSFETILDAASLVRDTNIHWIIIGDGRMRGWIAAEIESRQLASTVHLLGRRPVSSMPRYFALADCLLVSLRDTPEFSWTIPAKLQSYMACGKPIVAALEGEGRRIVEEAACGLVAGSCKPAALAAAVRELSTMSDEELKQMGERGRLYYDVHFARDRLVSELRQILSEVG